MRPTFEECQKICEENNLKLTREIWSDEGYCHFAYCIRRLKTDSKYFSIIQKDIEERERVVEVTRYLGDLLKKPLKGLDLVNACLEYKYINNDPINIEVHQIVSKLLPNSKERIGKWEKIEEAFNLLQYSDEHDNKINRYGWIFHILSREKVPFEEICDAMEKVGEKYAH